MGKIIISENVSLDGVIEDPTGDEGFSRFHLRRPAAAGGEARAGPGWRTLCPAISRTSEPSVDTALET